MTSLIPNSPISPQELQFKKQLEALSQPGIFTGHLIVKEQGSLGKTNFLHALWEKFKGVCGFRNWTNERLVEFKTLQFLTEGRKWVNSDQDIERVKILASRVGLTQSGKSDHSKLQQLINEICQPSLNQKIDQERINKLLNKFVTDYNDELRPFPEEILKISQIFDRVLSPNMVTAPSIKHTEKNFAEEDTEKENKDNPTSTSQQDSGQAQEQKTSEIPSAPSSTTEKNILSRAPITPKTNNSHLLKIPELPANDSQTVTGPLLPTAEEEKPVIAQNESKPVIEVPVIKAEVLSPKELASNKWKTAEKVALIAAGTIVVLAATYYAWQHFGNTAPDTANDVLEEPLGYQSPNGLMPQITNITDRIIRLIYPSLQDSLITDNSTVIEQITQGFTPVQPDFFEQITPTLVENTPILPQTVVEAATNLFQISKEIVYSSHPVCLPGDNPDISLNSVFDFINNPGNHPVTSGHTLPITIPTHLPEPVETELPIEATTSTTLLPTEHVVNTVVEQASYIKEIAVATFLALSALAYVLSRKQPAVEDKTEKTTSDVSTSKSGEGSSKLPSQPSSKATWTPEEISKMSPDQQGELIDKHAIRDEKTGKSQLSLIQLRGMIRSTETGAVKIINQQEIGRGHCGRYCINNALQKDVLTQDEFLKLTAGYFVENLEMSEEGANQIVNDSDDFGVDSHTISYIVKRNFGVDLRSEKISDLVQPDQSKQQALEKFLGESDWAIIANAGDHIYEMPSQTNAQYPFTKGHLTALSKDKDGNWWYIDSHSPNPININLAVIPSSCTLLCCGVKAANLTPLAETEKKEDLIPNLNELTADQIRRLLEKMPLSPTPEKQQKIKVLRQQLLKLGTEQAHSYSSDETKDLKKEQILSKLAQLQTPELSIEQKKEKIELESALTTLLSKKASETHQGLVDPSELQARIKRGRELIASWQVQDSKTPQLMIISPYEGFTKLMEGAIAFDGASRNDRLQAHFVITTISNTLENQKKLEIVKQNALEKADIDFESKLKDIRSKLEEILSAELAIDDLKKIYLESILKKLDSKWTISDILKQTRELIGEDVVFPVDYQIALLELVKKQRHREKTLNYLQLAKIQKNKINQHSKSDSAAPAQNILQRCFSLLVEPEAMLVIDQLHDVSAIKLMTDLNNFNFWVIARSGSDFNAQNITDSIEVDLDIPLSDLTSEARREVESVEKEKILADFFTLKEKELALAGYRPHDAYGIKVKNEWARQQTHSKTRSIQWKGNFAIKMGNDHYKHSTHHGAIDFTELGPLSDKNEKAALKFVWEYCKSDSFNRNLFENRSIKDIPSDYQPLFLDDPDFWKWIAKGSSEEDTHVIQYTANIDEATKKYKALVDCARQFSKTIDETMIAVFVGKETFEVGISEKSILKIMADIDSTALEEDIFDPEDFDEVETIRNSEGIETKLPIETDTPTIVNTIKNTVKTTVQDLIAFIYGPPRKQPAVEDRKIPKDKPKDNMSGGHKEELQQPPKNELKKNAEDATSLNSASASSEQELNERRALGTEILTKWLKEGTIQHIVRNEPNVIPFGDYEKLIEGRHCDTKSAYSTILKLDARLKFLKDEEYHKLANIGELPTPSLYRVFSLNFIDKI